MRVAEQLCECVVDKCYVVDRSTVTVVMVSVDHGNQCLRLLQ